MVSGRLKAQSRVQLQPKKGRAIKIASEIDHQGDLLWAGGQVKLYNCPLGSNVIAQSTQSMRMCLEGIMFVVSCAKYRQPSSSEGFPTRT